MDHYHGKITLDDAKELLHIAMNNGRFEYYLERDHGIRTDQHSPALIQMREQTNRPGGLRDILLENGDAICGSGNFTKLREDVYTRKNYASTLTIYTDGARPNDSEKAKRTLFALMLHTIERRVMRVCVDVALEMKLVPFSSVFDGLQLIHPRVTTGLANSKRTTGSATTACFPSSTLMSISCRLLMSPPFLNPFRCFANSYPVCLTFVCVAVRSPFT